MSDERKVLPMPNMREILAEAGEWLVRLDDEDVTAKDYEEFLKWRGKSDQHLEAFERLSADWKAFDQLEMLNDYAASVDSDIINQSSFVNTKRRWFIGMAASAAIVSIAAVLSVQQFGLSNGERGSFQTAIGERKTVNLADGTLVELNTNSIIEANYSKSMREVRLVQGEAFFEIARNPNRPFSVLAGNGVVTALGTSFTVRVREKSVDVLVTEGRVQLAANVLGKSGEASEARTQNSLQKLELDAGQDAIINHQVEHIGELDPKSLTRRLAWRNGVLSFDGQPLSEVVADMSRYTQIRIEIDDDELRKLPVDGHFRIGEIESMLEALVLMADIKVERIGTSHVRLSRG